MHMKKMQMLLVVLCCSLLLTACMRYNSSNQFWGSYTSAKTYSYDHKLYAVQTVVDQMIVVTVYNTETDEEIDSFSPARSLDFWGICWEKDTYNIWTQSSDIGIYCYEYQNWKWILNKGLTTPNYIISRYDEEYRDNPEIQKDMYKSPIE